VPIIDTTDDAWGASEGIPWGAAGRMLWFWTPLLFFAGFELPYDVESGS
jgi:hypothetical protein